MMAPSWRARTPIITSMKELTNSQCSLAPPMGIDAAKNSPPSSRIVRTFRLERMVIFDPSRNDVAIASAYAVVAPEASRSRALAGANGQGRFRRARRLSRGLGNYPLTRSTAAAMTVRAECTGPVVLDDSADCSEAARSAGRQKARDERGVQFATPPPTYGAIAARDRNRSRIARRV